MFRLQAPFGAFEAFKQKGRAHFGHAPAWFWLPRYWVTNCPMGPYGVQFELLSLRYTL